MPNERITDLPSVVSSQLTDIIYAVTGFVSSSNPGTSVQQTLSQVQALMQANIVLHNAGNPNGVVAGSVYQLCWDTTNNVLYVCTTTGSASTAVWTLAGSVTFPISLSEGGTGASLTASNGGIFYSTATAGAILSGTATARQMLQSGSTAAPTWSTTTWPATSIAGNLLYSSANNTVSDLTTTARAVLASTSASVPNWLALTDGQLVIGSTAGQPAAGSLTAGSGITITPGSNSISIAASSGSGSPLTTKGDLYTFSTVNTRLAVGTVNGQILQVNSVAATGLAYSTATYPSTTTINQLLFSSAANTVTGLATANSATLVTNSSGVPAWTASLTNGQILIGSTGATPTPATLTAGSGVSISNGAGSITISGTGSGIGWTEVTGTSQTMSADSGYVANNVGLVTFTLPATAAFGTAISVIGKGAGGWKINVGTGQTIQVGSVATTITTGSVASTNQFDSIDLICTTANTVWTTLGGVQGNLTIV